jgi:uncharacterized protein (DUF427 family)
MRPANAIPPGPGQESVWDYPRPPRLEPSARHIQVYFNDELIADTRNAFRVLETSHPPVYYIPPGDVKQEYLTPTDRTTFCEWKGRARYYTVTVGDRSAPNAAWYYPSPLTGYLDLAGYIAFYPSKMDTCLVDGERAQAQEGDFYGGWITRNIVGPFKGGPRTVGW